MQADEETKERFYSDLNHILARTPREDKLFLLGDFNARVGRDPAPWGGAIGKHGVGKINDNGILLLTICAEYNLTITNTIFRQQDKYKTSWKHPRSGHWHSIDYVITRACDRQDVHLTRAIIDSEHCWTDHRLIRSILNINILPKRRLQAKQKHRKINVAALESLENRQKFNQHLTRTLANAPPPPPNEGIEGDWKTFKTSILKTSEEVLGHADKHNQDWFDQNDLELKNLISKKRNAFTIHQNDQQCKKKKKIHSVAKAKVQTRTRELKNKFWLDKALEIEELAKANNTHAFFNATRAIYGPKHQNTATLRSKDGGHLLKTNDDIAHRWEEHFEDLLNRPAEVDNSIYAKIPPHPIKLELTAPPTLQELERAIREMKNNKAAGADGIPAELYKLGGQTIQIKLHTIILKIWCEEHIPADMKDAMICTIFKKGDKTDCGNYRGISLLSIAGKILARILSNRLKPLAEELLPESQCGFRPSRGTADMVFSARQLQEKSREQNKPLYMAFFDLTKAFDTVNREALWRILSIYGCPSKFIKILRLLHDDMEAVVRINGTTSSPFKVTTGVKQGCVIAPTLFTIFLAAMMHQTTDLLPDGVGLTYRLDGGVFNIRRLNSRTKTTQTSVVEFQYADDNMVCAQTEADLQNIVTVFAEAYSKMGLTININKTKVLYQPAPQNQLPAPAIQVEGQPLESVENFTYLGSQLSASANIDRDIQQRIGSASGSIGKLRKNVFDNRNLTIKTKMKVYNAVVLPTLLYGAETWISYRKHVKMLERFHQRFLRKILGITWRDKRTNTSIIEAVKTTSIEAMITQHQLRWAGHLARMPNDRLPKQLFYSQLTEGLRGRGRPKLRYKDCLKNNLTKCEIDTNSWEISAHNRQEWRKKVHQGVSLFENQRKTNLADKRERRKERERERERGHDHHPAPQINHICPTCDRVCASRIGLFSHERTHRI